MFLFQPKHKVLIDAVYNKPDANNLSILIHHIHLKKTRLTKIAEVLYAKMRHKNNIKITCNIFKAIMQAFPGESLLYEEFVLCSVKRGMKKCEDKIIISLMEELAVLGINSFKGEYMLSKLIKEISKAMETAHKKEANKESINSNENALSSNENDQKISVKEQSEISSSESEIIFTTDRDNFLLDLLKTISQMNFLNFEFPERMNNLMNTITLSKNLQKARKIFVNICRALNIVNVKSFCYEFFWYATHRKFCGIDLIFENVNYEILPFLIIEGNRFLGENCDDIRELLKIEIIARDKEKKKKEFVDEYMTASNADVNEIKSEQMNETINNEQTNKNDKKCIQISMSNKNNADSDVKKNVLDKELLETYDNVTEEYIDVNKTNIKETKPENIIQTYEYILKKSDKKTTVQDDAKKLKELANKIKIDNEKEDKLIEKEQEGNRDYRTQNEIDQKKNELAVTNTEEAIIKDNKKYINKNIKRKNDVLCNRFDKAINLQTDEPRFYGPEILSESLNKYAYCKALLTLQWLYTPVSISKIASRHSIEIGQSFFYLFKQIFNKYKKFDKDDLINVEMNVYCNIGFLNQKYTDNDFLVTHDEKDLFILKYLHIFIKNCEYASDVLYLFVKKSFQEQLINKPTQYTECFQKYILFIVGKYAIEGRCKFNCKFFILLIRICTTVPLHQDICYWLIDKGCDYYEAELEEIKTILGKIRVMYNATNNRFLYRALVKLIDYELKETLAVIYLTDKNKCKILMQELNDPKIFDEVASLTYNKAKDEVRFNELCGNTNMYTLSVKSSLNLRTFADKRKSRIGGFEFFKFL